MELEERVERIETEEVLDVHELLEEQVSAQEHKQQLQELIKQFKDNQDKYIFIIFKYNF